jgi:hypothetical protein
MRSDGSILGDLNDKALGSITAKEHHEMCKNDMRWSKMILGSIEIS